MKIQAKVVARMQTGGKDFARVGVKGPKGAAALRFFDIEDFGELSIGDKLDIEITRAFTGDFAAAEKHHLDALNRNPEINESEEQKS